MADEAAELTEVAPEPVVEAQPEETQGVVEDDREPGGSSPEETRARKEYRTRKKVEAELAAERQARIELEQRFRAVEEKVSVKPAAPEPKVFTMAEIAHAVSTGAITPEQGAEYERTVYIPHQAKVLRESMEKDRRDRQPIERAQAEIGEYVQHLGWTKDKGSSEYTTYIAELGTLVHGYGMPDNAVTQRIALEKVAGPLDKIKAKAATARNTRTALQDSAHFEAPNGGLAPTNRLDISKAPAAMQRMWEATGTSPAARAVEFKHWQERQKR